MNDLLKAWSKITRLSFQGESHFSVTDEKTGELLTSPESSQFACCFADLELNTAHWKKEENNRQPSWAWIPFPKPIRYWIDYHPQVHRWIDGNAPFHSQTTKETCDGNTVIRLNLRDDPRRNRYLLSNFKSGRMIDKRTLGLSFFPPFILVDIHKIVSKINESEIAPDSTCATPDITTYMLWFPDTQVEAKVVWHCRYNWFLSVETKRWGIPPVLLEKLSENPNLCPEDVDRLHNEREITQTSCYEASGFDDNSEGEIIFPRTITYTSDWRKRQENWRWKFDRWNTAPELSDELFRINIPEGARVSDCRNQPE